MSEIAWKQGAPQWGGYSHQCVVTTSREPGACFDVKHFSDGEFNTPDGHAEATHVPPTDVHYCDPKQLLSFGLDVLERQAYGQRWKPEELRALQALAQRIVRMMVDAECFEAEVEAAQDIADVQSEERAESLRGEP
jgi:hypothetical protein